MNELGPQDAVRAALPRLKVFPLPSAVLFPGLVMPLHIFEARYRQMVKDALEGDGVIALAGFGEDNWTLAPIACAGVIAWHEQLPNGRYNLLLEGRARVRLREELEQRALYREVSAELLEDAPYQGPEEEAVRRALLELAAGLPAEAAEVLVKEGARARGGALADVVAAAVVADPARRRALLEELSPRLRLVEVMEDLSEVLARVRTLPRKGAGKALLH